MTPKVKAQDLFVKMIEIIPDHVIQENSIASELAKQFTLIAVDEILNINSVDKDYYLSEYWEQVKKELELL